MPRGLISKSSAGFTLRTESSVDSPLASTTAIRSGVAASNTNPANAPKSAWGNTDRSSQMKQDLRKTTLLKSTAKSQTAMQLLSRNVSKISIADPSASRPQAYYDASNAPGASAMTTAPKPPVAAPSQATAQVPVRTDVAICSGYSRYDFRPGELISIRYHESNTNANVLPTDPNLAFTIQGPVYSKRRLAIVLWVHHYHMFCIPLYTHSGQGLKNKKGNLLKEYVCVINDGENPGFENDGKYPPIVVSSRKPMKPESSAHITGGFKVPCNGDVLKIGGLVGDSYRELMKLWKMLAQTASGYTWTQ